MGSTGFTKAEIAQLKLAIKDAVEPIASKIQEHDQTLYGEDHQNGLRGDMKDSKAWRDRWDRRWAKAVGVIVAAQILIGVLSYLADKWVNHLHAMTP